MFLYLPFLYINLNRLMFEDHRSNIVAKGLNRGTKVVFTLGELSYQ
jgi:hypothetical protein